MKNKNVGAKVQIRQVLLRINPKEGWVYQKKVTGTIVKDTGFELYYHTSSGGRNYIQKYLMDKKNNWNPIAVKLDNDLKDIEGNNTIMV